MLEVSMFVADAGIAGLFTIFSSFVFSVGVINFFGTDLTGLKYTRYRLSTPYIFHFVHTYFYRT